MQAHEFDDALLAFGDLFEDPIGEPFGVGSFLEPIDGSFSSFGARDEIPREAPFTSVQALQTDHQSHSASFGGEDVAFLPLGSTGLEWFEYINMDHTEEVEETSAGSSIPPTAQNGVVRAVRQCRFPGCPVKHAPTRRGIKDHLMKDHPCQKCGQTCSSVEELGEHATQSGHLVFVCTTAGCNKGYSRHDSLARHREKHMPHANRHSCPYCPRYRGNRGFDRRDHLYQHFRSYHHMGADNVSSKQTSCPHPGCADYRVLAFDQNERLNPRFDDHAFKQRSAFHNHMRKAHFETPYGCPIPGCDRIGAKGWFRASDRRKHQLKEHADVVEDLEKLNMEVDAGMPNYFRNLF